MTSVMLSMLLLSVMQISTVEGAGGKVVYGAGWNYLAGKQGPALWYNGTGNEACGQNSQSPINIQSGDATHDKALKPLELENYDVTTNMSFTIKNRATDLEFMAVANSGNAKDIPQTVTFKDTKYRLYQLHFHWGKKTLQGSEHQLDSQQYAGEMHIIHYNDKYADVGAAIDKSDGLLVWGHFLQVTSETRTANTYFDSMINFDSVRGKDATKKVTLNLAKFLPVKYDTYFHYSGSLTTPPCYESVKWIVNPTPLKVSESMMRDQFRKLTDDAMKNFLNVSSYTKGDNYRPVQPLNGRKVYTNFDQTAMPPCNAATGVSVQLTAIVGSVLMAMFYATM